MASISVLKFEAGEKGKNSKRGGHGMTANLLKGNGRENHELICRSESSDRSGDELHRVDGGRHGPGVANENRRSWKDEVRTKKFLGIA
jgi:hypothetical protein